MAPSFKSFHTEMTIDISQDEHTPVNSTPLGEDQVLVHDTIDERVEDSVRNHPDAHKSGPVRPLQSTQLDEYDELYSLSPQSKASFEKLKSSVAESAVLDGKTSTISEDMCMTSNTVLEKQAPLCAVDGLLARAATVHQNGPTPKRKTKHQASNGVGNGKYDSVDFTVATYGSPDALDESLQRNEDDLNMLMASRPKSSRKSARAVPTAQSDKAVAQKESTPTIRAALKAPVGSAASSLAALQARKQTQRNVAEKIPLQGQRSLFTELSTKRNALQARNQDLQTPACAEDTSASGERRPPTTGKLPSRKNGMFVRTDAREPKKQEEAAEEPETEKINITVANGARKKRQGLPLPRTGMLKRPARGGGQMPSKSRSKYDVPDSPTDVMSQPPAKRARTTKTPISKKPGASVADSTTGASRRPVKPAASTTAKSKAPQKGIGQSSVLADDNDREKPTSTRRRMNVTSNARHEEASSRSSKVDTHATSTGLPKPTKDQGPNEQTKSKKERAEVFEQAVVDHDYDDDGHTALSDSDLAEKKSNHATPKHPRPMKTDDPHIRDSGRDALAKEVALDDGYGASQEKAIVLSDRQPSSSPAAPNPRYEKALSAALPQGIDRQGVLRNPKTPSVFPSSPPLTSKQRITDRPTGLVDANAARRATIISFDKSGPRNQGSLSGSMRPNRSSLPPTVAPLSSHAGSGARFEAKRRKGPSSAATSVKSFRMDRAAAKSNTAENVPDALAGFARKAPKEKEERASDDNAPAAVSHPAPQDQPSNQQPRNDDEFAMIDEFESTTLVDGEDTANNVKAAPVTKHTASQVAMPPQTQKPSNVRKLHRAFTVPAMLGSDLAESAISTGKHDDTKHEKKRTLDVESSDGSDPKCLRTDESVGRVRIPPQKQTVTRGKVLPKPTLPQHHSKPMPEPTKRVSRKSSRQMSQGSQKVDMYGSPVPEGMIVPDKSTVLEHFSQHVDISSDLVDGVTTIAHRLTGTRKPHSSSKDHGLVRLSRQPEILSSNSKPVPAEPHEESQAITRTIRVDPRRPIVEDETRPPPTNSFTSSKEARKEPSQRSSSWDFIEQLRQMTAAKAHEQVEDPDKTLVESERRTSSLSTKSSSDSSAESEDSSTSTLDLALWRNALQPHQMDLFDELVAVSHKLVRHLVDQETAVESIKDHYRRRGLHIIEQMEATHAKQHQKDVQALKERKKRLKKELVECDKRLKGIVGTFESSQGERKDRKETNAEEEQLLSVMDQYC